MTFSKLFICLIIFGVLGFLEDLILIYSRRKESKKHNYNCLKCGVWDCPNKECLKFRDKEGA